MTEHRANTTVGKNDVVKNYISRLSLIEFKSEFLKPLYTPAEDEKVEVLLGKQYIQVIIVKDCFNATAIFFNNLNVELHEDGVSVNITSEKWREYMAQKFGDEYVNSVAEYMREKVDTKRKELNDQKMRYQHELKKLRMLLKS